MERRWKSLATLNNILSKTPVIHPTLMLETHYVYGA